MNNAEIKTKGCTIAIYGSRKDQEVAYDLIANKHFNKITGNEVKDRIYLMHLICNLKVKAAILYNGNTVYDNNKILRNLRTIKRQNDMSKMTKYTYQWLTLACGSIAHYNIHGWIAEYPTVKDLRNFFHSNEFNSNIYDHVPDYNSSNKALALEVLKIFK